MRFSPCSWSAYSLVTGEDDQINQNTEHYVLWQGWRQAVWQLKGKAGSPVSMPPLSDAPLPIPSLKLSPISPQFIATHVPYSTVHSAVTHFSH